MIATPTSAEFSSARAQWVATRAATAVGLGTDPISLIRLGSNAIIRLPAGVVARVGRDESWAVIAEREVRVAAALRQANVPCVRPWPVRQPVIVEGHPVTFWAEVPSPLHRPSAAQLGAALRRLHGVDADLCVPALDPWAHIPERIERAPVSDGDRRVMRTVLAQVQDGWVSARFELGVGLIHGDAHSGNLARGADGSVVLLDLDSVCVGPREWDLAPTGLHATSLGWMRGEDYRSFVAAYGGFDVTTAPVFPLLRRMRELRMTAWLAMQAEESPQAGDEFAHRIACLADPGLPRRWTAR